MNLKVKTQTASKLRRHKQT